MFTNGFSQQGADSSFHSIGDNKISFLELCERSCGSYRVAPSMLRRNNKSDRSNNGAVTNMSQKSIIQPRSSHRYRYGCNHGLVS